MSVSEYGSWKSPISSQLVTTSGVGLLEVHVDDNPEKTDYVYWSEIHYEEKGRYVICSANRETGEQKQWTPINFSARTTVHEYGGGDFFVYDGAVFFSNFNDQVLYKQTSDSSTPEPVTDTTRKWRYADGIFCSKASGADFYSHPRVSPDGRNICWCQWYHPNMPWDSTEVWTAKLDPSGDHLVEGSQKQAAGGEGISVIEPGWTPDNQLLYVSDESEWWNLYLVSPSGQHVNIRPDHSEMAGPQWTFGKTAYVPDPSGSRKILTAQNGELGWLDSETKAYRVLETGFRYNKCLALTKTGDAYCIGSSEDLFPCLLRYDINSEKVHIVKESQSVPEAQGYVSMPEFVSWPTGDKETSHGIFYPPYNKDFKAPEGTKPPLLVRAHGGPTSHFFANLDLKLQYFTSRGFAVILVNYRGSTGYGRSYRHRLREMWGVYDVEDCCTAVDYLVQTNRVDSQKICIDGGSAGGYTTLACLTFRNTFNAGASHFGIGDLHALMKDTHKFESRYIGRLCPPEKFQERSPIHHVNQINCPIALFQGDQDKIVPPNQAEMMYQAVKLKGLPTMYILFEVQNRQPENRAK
ncbi:hypothetical protein C0Q70_13483 [Pomacea canaliculata]|uniref:Peptidase S9 prolyl oligopeptidase catalytic domain-containing protein n=1 Tax=Pomacea canaliculata TaxID=400727 RepID=A0A2T7NXB4_POMCA|nr:hypothetical protein C0Q70_13483 [Pomacea canaliculata]